MACSKTDKPSPLPMVQRATIQREWISKTDSSSSNEWVMSFKRNAYVKKLRDRVESGMRMVEDEIGTTKDVSEEGNRRNAACCGRLDLLEHL